MMNYVENFDILEKKVKQIPCITGQGAPSTVDGAVGMLYIDTDSGLVYKCTSINAGSFVWKDITAEYNQALKALSEQVNDLSEELGAIANISTVPPDWDQNDESQPDFIKGRTHWTSKDLEYSDVANFSSSGRPKYPYVLHIDTTKYTAYKTYTGTIEIDGIGYDFVTCNSGAMWDCSDEEFKVIVGSSSVLVTYMSGGPSDDRKYYFEIFSSEDLSGSNISLYVHNVRTLSDEYIPTEIVRKHQVPSYQKISDWSELNSHDPGYIKNRTHYINKSTSILYNDTITLEKTDADLLGIGGTNYKTYLTDVLNGRSEAPSTLLVRVKGKEYQCTVAPGVNTSEPESLSQYKVEIGDGEYLALNTTYWGMLVLIVVGTEGLSGEKFTITCIDDIYNPLDERFVPSTIARKSYVDERESSIRTDLEGKIVQADWSLYDDTQLGYIKNRTHGIDITDYDSYENDSFEVSVKLPLPIVNGKVLSSSNLLGGIFCNQEDYIRFKFGVPFECKGQLINIIKTSDTAYNPTDGYYITAVVSADDYTRYVGAVKILLTYQEVKQLSEEYIPDDIGRLFYVKTEASSTTYWQGSNDSIKRYFDGLTIVYKTPNNGPGGGYTYLNINGLGNVPIYVNGTSPLTMYPTSSAIILLYDSSTNRWLRADKDTKDTVGALSYSNKKLYLVGTLGTSSSVQSYVNTRCYVGTDNCIYSNNSKVITEDDIDAQAYVITGSCTVVDSDIECSLDTTPDIEKIRDCMSNGKPCYLYLRDLDAGQYRIFTPVMDYDADDSIRFQHKDSNSIYTIDLCISDPTSINGSSYCTLVTTNSVYTTQVNGTNHGIFDSASDYYIPTNAMVVDALKNRWNSYIITNNADGTYSASVTFTNLTNIINKGREVVFRFTDCTGRNVEVPQINRGVSNLIDGKLYLYFSLVYPGLTEDTWNNTYRVFISINSDNELVVKHDVISNATVSAINTISEKLGA